MDYQAFLEQKRHSQLNHGFAPKWLPSWLYDFQAHLVEWALLKGRAAIFADCGLGKTPMQLVWAENVVRQTHKSVLILTPLAVAPQTIQEACKFDIAIHRATHDRRKVGIAVCNYEQLHHLDWKPFAGIVCDESSILKSFDGVRRQAITTFMRKIPYRLLCTATAAPNDYTELGTSSEALGELGHIDMLTRFFRNKNKTVDTKGHWRGSGRLTKHGAHLHVWEGQQWRFKGHAEVPFWQWVSSWARACRHPSDLGFSDEHFTLPPLQVHQHLTSATLKQEGMLFDLPAIGLHAQREERKRTLTDRCQHVATLVNASSHPALVWCHLNEEGNLLTQLIPDAIQIAGSDSVETKEERFGAFLSGEARVLVTKPKIGAWGLNLQHCAHIVYFPSHSYEQYYQGVRRCWRYGQQRPVVVDIVLTDGDVEVMESLSRKAKAADHMFDRLVTHMRSAQAMSASTPNPLTVEVPSWIR